ncbi:MAG: M28 family peptidase [Anaerolineales bacterium]|nr:M28 family peptidase [Anaerolineales bacterium]
MGRRIYILTLVILFVSACRAGGSYPVFNARRAYRDIQMQLSFGPRIPGTPAHAETAAWIQATLNDTAWTVETQSFSYNGMTITNIIASNHCALESTPIILGAHYDTRPLADQDPARPDLPVPGANDGASGVAVLLEIARVMPFCPPIQLVFFDAEDSGGINGWDWIVGSTYFADHLEASVAAVVIVDMVGDRDLSLPLERNSSPELQASIWSGAARWGYSAFETTRGYAMIDDHTPFLQRGIPAVDIIDFDYPAWHTVSDTIDQISEDSLEQVGQVLVNWLHERNSMNTEIFPVR